MSDFFDQFSLHWAKSYGHLHGQPILLAVSGGVDSMVLLNLFHRQKVPFAVAHCNFGLRGVEANLDEELVANWCAKNRCQFHVVRFDTKHKAAEWKKGTQETARILRYDWFKELQQQFGYVRVATAHHANDNVETLLINLFRGTGIQGLHGIAPDNGQVIRPLLYTTRALMQDYAAGNNVTYREDESNKSDNYLRNAVRNNLLPVVTQLFPDAINHVNDSIARFAEAEQLYTRSIEVERKKLIEIRGKDSYVPIRKLRNCTPLNTICYELFKPFGFISAQIPQIVSLMTSESGKQVLSATHRIIRNRDFLVVTSAVTSTTDFIPITEIPCIVDTGSTSFTFTVVDTPREFSADNNKAFIASELLVQPLILRKWRIGDYFYPIGMGMKKKKVSRLLIDNKIPLHQKEDIWVLVSDNRIVWVSGIRLDERFKVKPGTERVVVVAKS